MIRRMTPDSWKSFAAAWQAHLRQATPAQIDAFIAALRPGEAERLVHAWPLWARRSQLPPPGDWRVWLLMAGRGFGKTRAGAEWVRQLVEVAYNATDSLTLNLVYFKSQADEVANKNDDYKWTGVGAKYTIAPGLYTSIGYKNFDYTDKDTKTNSNSGNTIRLRVHAGF